MLDYRDSKIQKQLRTKKDYDYNWDLILTNGKSIQVVCLMNGLYYNFHHYFPFSRFKTHVISELSPFNFSPDEWKKINRPDVTFIVELISNFTMSQHVIDTLNNHIDHNYGRYSRWNLEYLNEEYFIIYDKVVKGVN